MSDALSPDSLLAVKLGFAVVVAAVGLVGALLPWVLRRWSADDRTLALSDSFAGGVLGGAGMIHLLGAGIDTFHAALPGVTYPLALLVAGVGFLLILLIEAVVVPGHPGHDTAPGTGGPAGLQHEVDLHPPTAGSRFGPVILLVVLSVHSVVLGLALGAQSALAGALVVFVAIIAHKAAAGVALGVGYRRAGLTRRAAMPWLAFFSGMTPLGIVVGSVVGAALTGRTATVFEAVFDSLGAGTFLYIAALDIIKTEFDGPRFHGQKWLAVAAGFSVMALLALWL
ncbi:ZIP family metal transporter [Isoptericola sp. b441]|uniref:ZIP family metal transporter n=1 Tax=Actinotalea lenta TaxID=3064654 RepID=A0ABT9DAC0_9CELL|nr:MULTISPECIES: ZIP family metal transporter [unclassified Isoptericola]MDO8107849.1 ZIP family metal transporter [Isoptericola sp. b441]MDO8120481.1 ZIP family metal transporter [Isoptericola sp. b490]